ncbi:MFS transporter [Actinokineospora sp. UTMC 2448]|uniref:MFS transporter n=1 Tax=Actinokineospora sp. UTMC 2448 TaxID=2268449 RepID=UPI00216424AE|nr:MFS transporter [Actinokineospora sp. UTMC 2448]UVS82033.1 Inner membrane metabolite transport protein YhjE [Actinokineospora sp. UTMC 2448]
MLKEASTTKHRKVAVAAFLASTFEWYDYFIFGTAAALVLGDVFFPVASPVAGVLAAFATFAVGFVVRPIGAAIAGHMGDRYGRKPTLVLALIAMGAATTGIGLTPSYAAIGIAAPVILVLLRLLQGIAVGAQWGGAMLLATEYAPPGKRGLYGSFVQVGVVVGVVLANMSFAVLQKSDAFAAWMWRIPFLVGPLVLLLAWFIHARIAETPEFRGAERSPVREVLKHHRGKVLLAGGSFAVHLATFYILITGSLDYTTRELGMDRGSVLVVAMIVAGAQIVTIPLAARLSDKVGRFRVYTIGVVGLLVWAFPMFLLIDTAAIPALIVAQLVGATFLSCIYGPQAALFAELFAPQVRYTGASLAYQIASVLGGGLAPFLMVLLLESTGTSMAVSGYIAVLALIALACVARLRVAER